MPMPGIGSAVFMNAKGHRATPASASAIVASSMRRLWCWGRRRLSSASETKAANRRQGEERDDEELEGRDGDVDEPRRAACRHQRADGAEHQHDHGQTGAEHAEPAVEVDASGGHEGRLREQQQEPGGEGDAMYKEEGLGSAVEAGPVGVPGPGRRKSGRTQEDGRGDRDGETGEEEALGGPAGATGRGSGGDVGLGGQAVPPVGAANVVGWLQSVARGWERKGQQQPGGQTVRPGPTPSDRDATPIGRNAIGGGRDATRAGAARS